MGSGAERNNMSSKAEPCNTCGDLGDVDAIITCSECKSVHIHLYCMMKFREAAPPFWSCEECAKKKLFSPRPGVKKHLPEASTPKVSSFVQTSTRVSGGQNKNASGSRFNFKEIIVQTGRTKYISCEEAVKLSSEAMKSEHPPRTAFRSPNGLSKHKTLIKTPQRERTAAVPQSTGLKENPRNRGESSRRTERTNKEKEMKTAKSDVQLPRKEEADVRSPNLTRGMSLGSKSQANVEAGNSDAGQPNLTRGGSLGSKSQANMEAGTSDARQPDLTRGVSKHHPYIPAFNAYWRGSFYLPYGPTECFDEAFKAHLPSRVHSKVYETLKKLPKKIQFELVPKREVWMEIFPCYCPDSDDIGLYFFPRSEKCISMMELLWSKNMVMRSSNLDEVELLVLSSRLLQPHSQEFQGNYFLWGVFRRVKKKKQRLLKRGRYEGGV